MRKNGFVFIETIVAIVVLTSSLLLLYSTFSKVLQVEKNRINYDDVIFLYRTNFIRERLTELNISDVLKELDYSSNKSFIIIGMEYPTMFEGYDNNKNFMEKMFHDFSVKQVVIVKENKLSDIKKCIINNTTNTELCNSLQLNLDKKFLDYIKTIYIEEKSNYLLLVEYELCNDYGINCRNYFSWVSV